jgi:hypothetical protein
MRQVHRSYMRRRLHQGDRQDVPLGRCPVLSPAINRKQAYFGVIFREQGKNW